MGLSLDEALRPGTGRVFRTGHRGARGLAPENTIPAMETGLEVGVDALEFDVQQTRDGELVVIHDPTVNRTTDGEGAIAELSLAELREFDAGYRFTPDGGQTFPFRGRGIRIPTLQEVLEASGDAFLIVELKPSPYAEFPQRTLELVRERAPGRAMIGAFPHRLIQTARRLAPDLPTGCSQREIVSFFLHAKLGTAGWWGSPARVLQIPRRSRHETNTGLVVANPRLVRAAQRTGRSVQVWTINEPSEMRRLIELGVDGITTDRPDLLNEVLRERSGGT